MPMATPTENLQMARQIAEAVDKAGGSSYFVGGYVRDLLLGRENKDIDIEIHGVTVQQLEEILDALGTRTVMGTSFGIFGLSHYDLDIAMPRTEQSTGAGHRDFSVFVDPFIGMEKAASRRDFTINAMMQNVLTGEILDFFGGREDLKRGLIRHVNDLSFAEDPLRVFRAAQFAARFKYPVADETRALSSAIDVSALAGERVMGELEKALLKADRPSLFFEELRAMHQLSVWFPELETLIGVPQNAAFHPEGDVWTHTMQVLDEAAVLREQAKDPLGLMLAALCHDFGKALVTEEIKGAIHAYEHERAGLPLVDRFLLRIVKETKRKSYVRNLVEDHMRPNMAASSAKHDKTFMKLFDGSCCPEDLLLLVKADYLGRQVTAADREVYLREYRWKEDKLRAMLSLYRERMAEPYLMGRDLIEAGVQPGPVFSRALDYAHKLRLAGISKDEQRRQTLGYLRKEQKNKTT